MSPVHERAWDAGGRGAGPRTHSLDLTAAGRPLAVCGGWARSSLRSTELVCVRVCVASLRRSWLFLLLSSLVPNSRCFCRRRRRCRCRGVGRPLSAVSQSSATSSLRGAAAARRCLASSVAGLSQTRRRHVRRRPQRLAWLRTDADDRTDEDGRRRRREREEGRAEIGSEGSLGDERGDDRCAHCVTFPPVADRPQTVDAHGRPRGRGTTSTTDGHERNCTKG